MTAERITWGEYVSRTARIRELEVEGELLETELRALREELEKVCRWIALLPAEFVPEASAVLGEIEAFLAAQRTEEPSDHAPADDLPTKYGDLIRAADDLADTYGRVWAKDQKFYAYDDARRTLRPEERHAK